MKATENKLSDLSEKLKQAEIYRRYRPVYKESLSQKPKKKEDFYNAHTADLILYDSVVRFLKRNFNHGKLPVAEWRAQIEQLTPKKKSLYADMYRLRDEVKAVEDIKKQLDSITQEQTRQKSRKAERLKMNYNLILILSYPIIPERIGFFIYGGYRKYHRTGPRCQEENRQDNIPCQAAFQQDKQTDFE